MFSCRPISLIRFFIAPVILGLIFSPFLFYQTAQASVQTSVVVTVTGPSVCGNNGAESGEDCDGSDLASQNCQSLGYGGGGTLSCNANCTFNTSLCLATPPSTKTSGGGSYTPPSSILILRGTTSPGAVLTVLKDSQIFIIGQEADDSGNFEIRVFGISAGVHTFSFRAKDRGNRESVTFSATFTLSEGMTTTISGILLPPTIELKGNILKGETVPQGEISIYISSEGKEIIKKTKAKIDGTWSYGLGGAGLQEKTPYLIKAKSSSPDGLMSVFSQALDFYFEGALAPGVPEVFEIPVTKKIPADLNNDGRTNLIDFSVLLYWWGKDNSLADFNKDGKVDLKDFSIMMYYWTG